MVFKRESFFAYRKTIKMNIKEGDIFACGKHKLMCGDSLKLTNIQKLLENKKANMIFTDPPYNIGYDRENHSWNHDYKSKVKNFCDINFDVVKLLNLINLDIVDGAVYLCCGTGQIGKIWDWISKNLKRDPRMLIWYKNNMSISRSDYHRRYETIMYFWIGDRKFRGKKDGTNQDVWFIKNRVVSKYIHPTQKPVALIKKAIENSSDRGNIILDFFGGSGSTLIACEHTGRICFMIEKDPHFCEIILKRWKQYTKEEPVLLT
jgi:DNA modification methylase